MKYCLIGKKLSHSYSCDIHNAKGYDYVLREIAESDLDEFFSKREYDGFNVTIPYKKRAAELCDFLSCEASETGSVNTVIKRDGKLYGYNTDIGGAEYMIARKGISLKDKVVLIAGTGGAGQTAVYCAEKAGAKKILVLSRSGDINYDNCYEKAADAEIFINATPVGMFPDTDGAPIDVGGFKRLIVIFDFIYNPFKTRLLAEAEKRGLVCSNGLPMLVEQALLAEDIWTDKTHTAEDVEKVVADITVKRGNIVLCGMPSSGKTVVGKAVAEILNREFVDTDDEIIKTTNKTPSEIITESGEKAFRDIETEIVKRVAKKSGAVIATGGGAVLKTENVEALKQNGALILIDRDLNLLTNKNRPLSQSKGIAALYEERKGIYEKVKDARVSNNGELRDTVKGVIKAYEDTCNKRS